MEEGKIRDMKTVSIEAVVRKLWKGRMFILKWCCIVVACSIAYILCIPRGYKSEVVLLPEDASSGGLSGSLGSLASLAGIKMGNMDNKDAISPEFYPKVISSAPFVLDLMDVPVRLEKEKKTVSFYSYIMEYQKSPWWGRIFAWLRPEEKEKEGTTSTFALGDSIKVYRLTKKQYGFMKAMQGMIPCRVDKKTDLITINVEMLDPLIAAYMADVVRKNLQDYIVEYRTSKARNDMEYMERITEEGEKKYLEAQRKYVDFADSYKELAMERFAQKGNRLETELQMARNVYTQSFQQLQLARAKVQEHTPVFVTVQPAVVPRRPSSPKRMVFVFMMGVLSFLVTSGWILGKDYVKRNDTVVAE